MNADEPEDDAMVSSDEGQILASDRVDKLMSGGSLDGLHSDRDIAMEWTDSGLSHRCKFSVRSGRYCLPRDSATKVLGVTPDATGLEHPTWIGISQRSRTTSGRKTNFAEYSWSRRLELIRTWSDATEGPLPFYPSVSPSPGARY